jgi:DNA sulfur modification protein DndD
MLHLRRLEIVGFGPYAEQTVIAFPDKPGVTVVYGDNMRGKTSLLNAMFYAFFGDVRGRNLRRRTIAKVTNRDLANDGQWGFRVTLAFRYDGDEYELVRAAVKRPTVDKPITDEDFTSEVYLRRGGEPLGPAERNHVLATLLPREVARFFLFDGELLSEYEELLEDESEAGRQISAAIEQILGVPVLKAGRAHLTGLADAASKNVAREAQRQQDTAAMGTALAQANERKEAHQAERERLQTLLVDLLDQRKGVEEYLRSREKYAAALHSLDEARDDLKRALDDETAKAVELRTVMADAWRTVLGETVRAARVEAEGAARNAFASMITTLRLEAVEKCHCEACDQDVPPEVRERLNASIPSDAPERATSHVAGVGALSNVSSLGRFRTVDVRPAVAILVAAIDTARMDQVTLRDRIGDLETDLAESDPDTLRVKNATLSDLSEKVVSATQGIENESKEITALEANIANWTERIKAAGTPALAGIQRREALLRAAAEVFASAVDQYKANLRTKVETTASALFLSMTTEKYDYVALKINENYGLSILHRDGGIEEGASAAAQQVVALALMGALQANAPLRGPIVMDTPFSRLDRGHKENVVQTLPSMAEQVILFVQEGEIARDRVREFLGPRLLREYDLVKETSRRTRIEEAH